MSYAALGFNNMSVSSPHIVKHPASSLLVIDSEDRNVASSAQIGNDATPERQPWNKFIIQTPDRLATGSINRICLRSVRFPWYIPNIVAGNNQFYVSINGTVNIYTLAPRFYTPVQLAAELQSQSVTAGVGIQVDWLKDQNQFVFSAVGGALVGQVIIIQAYNSNVSTSPLTPEQYYTNPSLAKTMGLNFSGILGKSFTVTAPPQIITTGSATECLYTHYVDIVSSRLLQYRRMIDGASKNANKKPIITRIYCANETSTNEYDNSVNGNGLIPIGTRPFLIHRKIEEKAMLWDSEATVDYLDFQVYDEYGQLVALPYTDGSFFNQSSTYPSFQMTFVLSE
jgi:hypothetical protein